MRVRGGMVAAALGLAAWAARGDVNWNGLYHNNTNLNAQTEMVPMGEGVLFGPRFLELDPAGSNVTVYFLTDHPACHGAVECRVRFYSDKLEYREAYWTTNVVLGGRYTFHATPAEGTYTVEVWKATWEAPAGFRGAVYYAPQVLEKSDPGDIQSLVREPGAYAGGAEWGDNGFFWREHPQAIGGENVFQVDYSFEWSGGGPLRFDWLLNGK